MLFPSSATIAILLDLVENELGSLTLVSAGDRQRLRELQRCRDALKAGLRQPAAANESVAPTNTAPAQEVF